MASGLLYPETVAALVLPLVILLALEGAERDSPGRTALAGGLLGVLALLRPVALVLPPVLAAWIAIAVRARGTRRLLSTWVRSVSPSCSCSTLDRSQLASPRTLGAPVWPVPTPHRSGRTTWPAGECCCRSRAGYGQIRWRSSRGGRQFLQFWELAPTRLTTDDPVRRAELNRRDPRLAVEPLFSRRLRDGVSTVSSGVELALALLGLLMVARWRWRQSLLLLAVIVAFAAGYALFVAKLRYRMPVLPLVFVFTGAGAAAIYSLALRRPRPRAGHGFRVE